MTSRNTRQCDFSRRCIGGSWESDLFGLKAITAAWKVVQVPRVALQLHKSRCEQMTCYRGPLFQTVAAPTCCCCFNEDNRRPTHASTARGM